VIAQVVEVALVVAAIVVSHLVSQRKMTGKVDAHHDRLEGQRDVQYKQAKQFQKELTSTVRATAGLRDECARTLTDVRQLHAVMEEFIKEVRARG